MSVTHPRISVRRAAFETSTAQFADDVRYYLSLSPRQLPSRYLYDALGSALFDAICELPWYWPTRAESALLARHSDEIFAALDPLTDLVELGPGSGEKMAVILDSVRNRIGSVHIHLVDVSKPALETAARALTAFDGVYIVIHQAPYHVGLESVRGELSSAGRSLVLFLGSSIGNFDPPGADAMLRQIRATLRRGDGFLLGADLVKPERDLLLAYDDPLGVTAAFSRNLLARINRELGADIDLDGFSHRAVWDAEHSRIETHLVSARQQPIRIPKADFDFTMNEGEFIWIESSYKYEPDGIARMLQRNGFRCSAQWVEPDARFSLSLAIAV